MSEVQIHPQADAIAVVVKDGDVIISRRNGGFILGVVDSHEKIVNEEVFEDEEDTGPAGALAALIVDAFDSYIAIDDKPGLVVRVKT